MKKIMIFLLVFLFFNIVILIFVGIDEEAGGEELRISSVVNSLDENSRRLV